MRSQYTDVTRFQGDFKNRKLLKNLEGKVENW